MATDPALSGKTTSTRATDTKGRTKKSNGSSNTSSPSEATPSRDRDRIVADYRLARQSREASVLGRKEVLTGKAKFGIFGDGKEVAQLAMAHAFREGDFRSGYYRDQTFAFATGMASIRSFFAQLYADTDVANDPASAGRQMNAHFANRLLDEEGNWLDQTAMKNTSADVSPTASQMPRLVGLSYASRLYRELDELKKWSDAAKFSDNGNEVAFGTIGNASAAEGMFFEAVNAIGVNRSPAVIAVWDDGYGISVPNEYQMTRGSVSKFLAGAARQNDEESGYNVYVVRGWDYPALLETFERAAEAARTDHVPALIHVTEVTQPQGHSTSGSHERYKSQERLQWELDYDPIERMRSWMIDEGVATDEELSTIDEEAKAFVRDEQEAAWQEYVAPILEEKERLVRTLTDAFAKAGREEDGAGVISEIANKPGTLYRLDLHQALHRSLRLLRNEEESIRRPLIAFRNAFEKENRERYGSHLLSQSDSSALNVAPVAPRYDQKPERLKGFEILNRCFDAALARDPRIIAFGEDVGQLGDVDQGFAGLQTKYGPLRVSDTGIREVTIVGQAIGMAMRGLRPIAEIQYLDYLLYALQIMSDDLATVQYRTKGGQKAPVIVRTRGHRLEGIWHSGSPMAGIINLVRGMHVLVPRDMTRAAGFYNTLLAGDDPALIVEVLSGYRSREPLPANIDELRIPLGEPEIIREGSDVTVVTYGACCRFAIEAADVLDELGVDVEIVDVQSLLPFDLPGTIGASIRKTGRVLFLDEDVPGGTTAFMMQKVVEEQQAWRWLDAAPATLSAREHRPAYGSDGGHFSKPGTDDIVHAVYDIMHESNPQKFPLFYR